MTQSMDHMDPERHESEPDDEPLEVPHFRLRHIQHWLLGLQCIVYPSVQMAQAPGTGEPVPDG
jgi:hypothetical protein